MSPLNPDSAELRILALGPSGKDAALIKTVLAEAGMDCSFLQSSTQLAQELRRTAGALIITEEAVLGGAQSTLTEFLRGQPAWAELPILILTTREASSPTVVQFMEMLGNVTLIERPMRIAVLVSALKAALRARQRQYQIRAHIAERARIEDALRETDRRKDEFLAALAHELRNPLAPISNTLHLLRSRGEERQEERIAHDVIRRQVQHLTRLVDDLLDVSRITRGKVALRREIVDLEGIIHNAVETSRPLIEYAGHHLEISLPDEPVLLHADAVRLAQTLSNLLNNAAKYTPSGGHISVKASTEEGSAVVRVIDDGLGIAPAALPHVFDLFMQEDECGGRAQGGLGIGLTLVRTFVQLHGGVVEAFSAGHGKGSEFVIRLPMLVAAKVLDPAPAELSLIPEHFAGHRILVVDDNEDGAQSLAMLLELQGNKVHTVYDGPQAVEAFTAFHPDVVLLDIGLPTLNGYDTARLIRSKPDARNALIIALTGWGQEEDRRRSREAGFDHHLVKPVDMHILEGLLAIPRQGELH